MLQMHYVQIFLLLYDVICSQKHILPNMQVCGEKYPDLQILDSPIIFLGT